MHNSQPRWWKNLAPLGMYKTLWTVGYTTVPMNWCRISCINGTVCHLSYVVIAFVNMSQLVTCISDLQRRCQFTFKCWRALFWAPYVCRMLEMSELNIEPQMDERVSLQFICLRLCPWYSFTHSTFADFPVSPFISSFDALKFARLGFCCLGACSFRCRREDRLRADVVRIFGMAGAVFWWVLMCSWFAYGFSNDLVVIFHYSEFIWSQVLSPIYCAFWIQVCSTWHRQFWSHSPKCLVNSFYRTACLLWPDTHQIPSWVRHVSASSRVHCFGHLSSGNRGNFRRKGLMHFRLSMAWPWTTSRWLAQSRPMQVLFAGLSQEFWKKTVEQRQQWIWFWKKCFGCSWTCVSVLGTWVAASPVPPVIWSLKRVDCPAPVGGTLDWQWERPVKMSTSQSLMLDVLGILEGSWRWWYDVIVLVRILGCIL